MSGQPVETSSWLFRGKLIEKHLSDLVHQKASFLGEAQDVLSSALDQAIDTLSLEVDLLASEAFQVRTETEIARALESLKEYVIQHFPKVPEMSMPSSVATAIWAEHFTARQNIIVKTQTDSRNGAITHAVGSAAAYMLGWPVVGFGLLAFGLMQQISAQDAQQSRGAEVQERTINSLKSYTNGVAERVLESLERWYNDQIAETEAIARQFLSELHGAFDPDTTQVMEQLELELRQVTAQIEELQRIIGA